MECCKTKYPILMLHGMGFRDRKFINYWGRIPNVLESHGAKIYYGHQDANATIQDNAFIIKRNLLKILKRTGAEKVNIIAHSKGGLEARYLASTLGMADKIASISTINTPHHGSKTVERLLKLPDSIIRAGSTLADLFMRISGDKNPKTYDAIQCFRTSSAMNFNGNNPDCDGIYYQSFGFKMKSATGDILMTLPYLYVMRYDGENDGLLAEHSVMWTNYKGPFTSPAEKGISHWDEVDFRRRSFSDAVPRNSLEVCDITEFYTNLVSDLKAMGL